MNRTSTAFYRLLSLMLQRLDPDFEELSVEGSPARAITRSQVDELMGAIPWVNWKPIVAKRDQPERSDGAVRMRLKPAVDSPDEAVRAVPQIPWLAIVSLPIAIIGGTIATASWFFPEAATVALVLAGALLTPTCILVLAARAAHAYRHRCHAVRYLVEWLETADGLTESVPERWAEARADPEIGDMLVDWFHQGPEIEAVEEHIGEGVQLSKHLSPVDPRRRTMQVEINAQRARRDQMRAQRDELAEKISALAVVFIKARERQRQEREQERREADAERRECVDFKRRWDQIDVAERERAKRHESIDEWFEKGSAGD